MNETLTFILGRRSVRSYLAEQIPDPVLNDVLLAAQYAPSGGNCQFCHFTVIQKPEVLSDLKRIVLQEFSKMEIYEGMYKSIVSAITQARTGKYDFLYGAPTFIIVTNKKGHANGMADSAAAIENMLIYATSVGIGSCWINQLHWLTDNQLMRSYLKTLGIEEDEEICGGLVLGYSKREISTSLARTGNLITKII